MNRPITRYFITHQQQPATNNQQLPSQQQMDLPYPNIFKGLQDEDGKGFINQFSLWADAKNLNEKTKIASFKLLLRENAARWQESLPANINTYDLLIEQFKKRYININLSYSKAALYNSKQKEDESARDFISRVICAAQTIVIAEADVAAIIIQGLNKKLRDYIIRSGGTTMDDIEKYIALDETSKYADANDTDDLKDRINSLELEMNSIKNINIKTNSQNDNNIRSLMGRSRTDTPPPKVRYAREMRSSSRESRGSSSNVRDENRSRPRYSETPGDNRHGQAWPTYERGDRRWYDDRATRQVTDDHGYRRSTGRRTYGHEAELRERGDGHAYNDQHAASRQRRGYSPGVRIGETRYGWRGDHNQTSHGCDEDERRWNVNSNRSQNNYSNFICYRCNKLGHIKRQCTTKPFYSPRNR